MQYDVIIIGGGPAGLCAGIYCARRGLKTLIIERQAIGGAMLYSEDIDNYPGFSHASGADISKRMEGHCRRLGVEFLIDDVKGMTVKGKTKKVKTSEKEFSCTAIILCTGGSPRKLGVPGEEQFRGKGVSYCATCDAPFFKGKTVAVIGGGSSAVTEALYLCKIAKKVMIIHRRDSFRAEEIDVKRIQKAGVQKIMSSVVKEIRGAKLVSSLLIETPKGEKEVLVDGVFIQVGTDPNSELAKKAGCACDEHGFALVDHEQATTLPGVFAAGDVCGGIEQIATAVGQGCVAALSAYAYVQKPYWTKPALKRP